MIKFKCSEIIAKLPMMKHNEGILTSHQFINKNIQN